jgi:hypothetical protein
MENKILITIEFLKKMNFNVFENIKLNKESFKKNDLLKVSPLLHKKIISMAESIILLNRNYKYSVSRMVLRNIFETSVLLLYLEQNPTETTRWANWNNLSDEDKNKIPRDKKKSKDFKKYLEDNNYKDALEIYTKQNSNHLRGFSPTFIREMAFKENLYFNGNDFNELYNTLCKFSHPSFVGMNHDDKLTLNEKRDIEKSLLFLLFESSDIFINILKDFIDESWQNLFYKRYDDSKTYLSKINPSP